MKLPTNIPLVKNYICLSHLFFSGFRSEQDCIMLIRMYTVSLSKVITWRLFLRMKRRFSAMYNFIQNFQNKSLISVNLTCIKHYLQTQFEFDSEKVGIFKEVGNLVIFNFTVRVFVRLFWRHRCRQRSGFLDLKREINLHSNMQYRILFRSQVREK